MSLFAELKRRNVIRVGVAYCVTAWLLAQLGEFAFENFGAPDWVLKSVVVVLLMGFPIVLIFAWAFELTPDGFKREREVDRSTSITRQTGRTIDRSIIAVLAIALAWFAWDKFFAAPAPEASPAATTGQAPAISVIGEPIPEKSVAVLPFVTMSNGPDDEYFADGLTEEILNSLAQLPELLVTARTSAFSFKGQDVPVQDIALALGVRHVVEGSVRRSGERLRVTAQLIRAEDAFHLWSQTYDRMSTDAITVQEDIAEKIAAALDVVLDEQKRDAMRRVGLRDVEAFTAYQKGMEAYERAHGDENQDAGLERANAYFDQVIEKVPAFAPVYIDHSDLYVHRLINNVAGDGDGYSLDAAELEAAYSAALADYQAAFENARTEEQRKMAELDLAYIGQNWRGIGGRLEEMLAIETCEDSNWSTIVSAAFGYARQDLERSYRILACDPRRSLSWFSAARAALHAGEKEEALRLAREGYAIAPGNWLRFELVRALLVNGHEDEAQRLIDEQVTLVSAAAMLDVLAAAVSGDEPEFAAEYAGFVGMDLGDYWTVIGAAWGGRRDDANELAARIDARFLGPVGLAQIIAWCACGAPWDLEATPNFAALASEGNLAWPPASPMPLPLKDW